MDFVNINFEIKNNNLNSENIKDINKKKKSISSSKNTQSGIAKPNSETLKAYNGMISFKGNSSPLEFSINSIAKSDFFKDSEVTKSINKDLIKNIVYSFDFRKQQFVESKNNNESTLEQVSTDKTKEVTNLINVLNQIKEKRIKEIDCLLNYNPKPDNVKNAANSLFGDEKSIPDDVKNAANSLFGDENTSENIENKRTIISNVIKTAICAKVLDVSSDNSALNKIYKLLKNELNLQQIAACLSLDINSDEDIALFKKLLGIKLEKQNGETITLTDTEAAILTKQKSEDKNSLIERYLEIKSHQNITYTEKNTSKEKRYKLSFYEMLLFAQNNFDISKLNRYVQIKTLPIEIEGVRQPKRTINLTTEQALKYTETDKLDEEIKAEFRLYELIDKGIDMSSAVLISQSPDLMSMLKEVDDKGEPLYSPSNIIEYAKLGLTSKQQVDAYNELKRNPDIDKTAILKIAKDGKIENIATYNRLMAQGLLLDEAIAIADDEKRYERFKNLLNSQTQVNIEDVIKLAEQGFNSFQSRDNFNKLIEIRPDLGIQYASTIADFPEFEKILALASKKYGSGEDSFMCTDEDIKNIANSINPNPDVSVNDFLIKFGNLIDLGYKNFDSIAKMANSPQFDKFYTLASRRDNNDNLLYTEDEIISIMEAISPNPEVSTSDFIRNFDTLSEFINNFKFSTTKLGNNTKLPIYIGTIADVANSSEFKKIYALLKERIPFDQYTDRILLYIPSNIGFNPNVSESDFIERFDLLSRPCFGCPCWDIAKFANSSEFDKLYALFSQKKDGEQLYNTTDISFIARTINSNPDVSESDFIKNLHNLSKIRENIEPTIATKIANSSEFDKLYALANLGKDIGSLKYSSSSLEEITDNIGKNPNVSVDDFIRNFENFNSPDFPRKREFPINTYAAQLANSSEFDKLYALINQKDKKGNWLYSAEDISTFATTIGYNSNISVDDFIKNFDKLNNFKFTIDKDCKVKIANSSQYNNIIKLIKEDIKPEIACSVYTDEKYSTLVNRQRKLTPKEVAFLTLHTPIDKFDLSLTSKLGKEVLTILNTGVTTDIVEAFCIANKNILYGQIKLENLSEEDIPSELIHIMSRKNKNTNENEEPKPYNTSTYRFNTSNNTFTFDGVNGKDKFDVELKKTTENGKTLLVVTNKNSQTEKYISYNGIIARVKPPELVEKDKNGNPLFDKEGNFILKEEKQTNAVNSLKSYARLSPEQADILSEAAQNFIVNIFEDNGECIIGKGITLSNGEVIKPIDGTNMTDSEIESHYKKVLQKLGDNVSIENILKLMPQNAMISINPYTTDDINMLYSIGVEWYGKSDKQQQRLWKMRIHTQDLKFIDDSKNWIYRLGYQEDNNEYYYNPTTNHFEIGSSKEETHVGTQTEDSNFNNSLISNLHFQNIIRQISVAQNSKYSNLGNLANKLGIKIKKDKNDESSSDDKKSKKIKPNEEEILVHSIIDKCCENASLYIKYKDEINSVLADFGISLF